MTPKKKQPTEASAECSVVQAMYSCDFFMISTNDTYSITPAKPHKRLLLLLYTINRFAHAAELYLLRS
jgi:hypothetical protein